MIIVYRNPADQDRHNAERAARILAAIEPQPDPRDEVIARLVEALDELADLTDDLVNGVYTPDSFTSQPARAAIAAAKAVLP